MVEGVGPAEELCATGERPRMKTGAEDGDLGISLRDISGNLLEDWSCVIHEHNLGPPPGSGECRVFLPGCHCICLSVSWPLAPKSGWGLWAIELSVGLPRQTHS